jgi:hypothetical protein
MRAAAPAADQTGKGETDMARVTMLPAWPLLELMDARRKAKGQSWSQFAESVGVPIRSLQRLLEAEEIHFAAADRWAIRLGYHASNIWPLDWASNGKREAVPA